jgi:hypothetical protein
VHTGVVMEDIPAVRGVLGRLYSLGALSRVVTLLSFYRLGFDSVEREAKRPRV